MGMAEVVVLLASQMGMSPDFIMETMAPDKIVFCFSKICEDRYKAAELQAAIIWQIASGKYESPFKKTEPLNIEKLKAMGILLEKKNDG